MIKVILKIAPKNVGKLERIGRKGFASSGYWQDFQYCITKAIEEFIKKYENEQEQ